MTLETMKTSRCVCVCVCVCVGGGGGGGHAKIPDLYMVGGR